MSGAAGLRLGWAIIDPGQPARAARRCAKKRAPRSRSCSAPRPGSWSPVSSRVSSRRRAPGSPTVLVVGFGLGALYWGLVLWRGAPESRRRRSQPRPRLEPQVGAHARLAEQRGRRFDHASRRDAAAASTTRGASVEHVERDRGRVHVVRRRGRASRARASRSGSRTDAITTACRRASTGTASSSERAAASSTRSVHTTIERALHAADRAEREVVVAVDERRLDVEDRAHHRLAARCGGARAGAGSRSRRPSRRTGRRARRRRARPS